MTERDRTTGARGALAAPADRYYADASSRMIALVVDAVLLTVLIFIVAIPVSLVIGPAVEFDSAADQLGDAVTVDTTVAAVNAALSLALSAGYFAASWVLRRATPGQRLLDLSVVREGDGARLGAGAAIVRWGLLGAPFGLFAFVTTVASGIDQALLDVPVAAWYLALLVTTARDSRKRGIHDRVAGTVVVKRAVPARWDSASAPDAV